MPTRKSKILAAVKLLDIEYDRMTKVQETPDTLREDSILSEEEMWGWTGNRLNYMLSILDPRCEFIPRGSGVKDKHDRYVRKSMGAINAVRARRWKGVEEMLAEKNEKREIAALAAELRLLNDSSRALLNELLLLSHLKKGPYEILARKILHGLGAQNNNNALAGEVTKMVTIARLKKQMAGNYRKEKNKHEFKKSYRLGRTVGRVL